MAVHSLPRLNRQHILYSGAAFVILAVVPAFIVRRATNTRYTLSDPPLVQLARAKQLDLGVYVAKSMLSEKDYTRIAHEQFGHIVIDGQPNWKFEDGILRPKPTEFDFSGVDTVLHFAQENNQPVRIQHLVWGEEKWLPDWLKSDTLSNEQLLDAIRLHIQTMVGRYKGTVREWTVVNEAFTRGLHEKGLNDWWGARLGSEYIDKAFIWAKETDPSAILILNDFNNESPGKVSDAMYEYAKDARSRGIPIDAIGIQMHIDGNKPPSRKDVIATMNRYGSIGLSVYVTEFDVNMGDMRGSKAQKSERQRLVYYEMLRACIESPYCHNFSILGITDKDSWYNKLGVKGAMPLPFDEKYAPKPAYYGIRQALLE